jgi:phosphoribosylamine-glycine ligase
VILASAGYPTSYKKGFEITMTEEAAAHTYVAGGAIKDGMLVTSGGRVTGTTAIADSLEEAKRKIKDGEYSDIYDESFVEFGELLDIWED